MEQREPQSIMEDVNILVVTTLLCILTRRSKPSLWKNYRNIWCCNYITESLEYVNEMCCVSTYEKFHSGALSSAARYYANTKADVLSWKYHFLMALWRVFGCLTDNAVHTNILLWGGNLCSSYLSHYLGKTEEIIFMNIWQPRASVRINILENVKVVFDSPTIVVANSFLIHLRRQDGDYF